MGIVGSEAPNFSAAAAFGGEIRDISLNDYKGKWLVLFFYPLDFTFVCSSEVVAFNDAFERFEAIGCEVLGCSIDSVHAHNTWIRTPRADGGVGDLQYPLLSDLDHSIMESFDVRGGAVAHRGVFVIDPDGVVQSGTVNVMTVGRNVDEVLRTVQACQHVREHGGGCPANWKVDG